MPKKPETAAYDAIREARSLGLDAGQTSSSVAEAVLKTAWDNAVDLHGGTDPDIQHAACDGGGCNLCILNDFATALGRPHFMHELEAVKAKQFAEKED